ncbi:hypothetical protein C8Q76DRAFT_755647 [Earliella scabrosa]|nr:hypothetical protein C8Q76DRAFT_755647 [Earliella scabrosa]
MRRVLSTVTPLPPRRLCVYAPPRPPPRIERDALHRGRAWEMAGHGGCEEALSLYCVCVCMICVDVDARA